MVVNNLPDVSPLDYHICWSLSQAETVAKTVSKLKDALQLLFALPQKAIDSAVKDFRKRLQACVSTSLIMLNKVDHNSHNRYRQLFLA